MNTSVNNASPVTQSQSQSAVSRRVDERHDNHVKENTAAGKTQPPESTKEHGAKLNARLEVVERQRLAKEKTYEPSKNAELTR